jgi:ComF family protein
LREIARQSKNPEDDRAFLKRGPVPGDFANGVLNLLFPPLCMACREPVGEAGLCPSCWGAITFLDGPACACCGLPFPVDLGAGQKCAACQTRPPPFASAHAIMAYDEHSRGAILALKHADRLELAPGFARWLMRVGRPVLAHAQIIVPVPLHRWRLWRRRYNQAAELARSLGAMAGIKVATGALRRTRATPSQGAMASAKARRRNVQSAFRVDDSAVVAGQRVILIDDVMTTGATAEACARALLRAGAAEVHVLALARVVRSTALPI